MFQQSAHRWTQPGGVVLNYNFLLSNLIFTTFRLLLQIILLTMKTKLKLCFLSLFYRTPSKLAKKHLKIHYFEEFFRETLTFFSSSGLTYHDLQSCYQKRMSFAKFLLDLRKTSMRWQTNNDKSIFQKFVTSF